MLINCHAHIFNFQSIYTSQSAFVFKKRLQDEGVPQIIIDAVMAILRRILDKDGDSPGTDAIHKELSREVVSHAKAGPLTGDEKKISENILGEFLIDANMDTGILAGFRPLSSLVERLEGADARSEDFFDWLRYAAIGLFPSMDQVTDRYMEQHSVDDVMLALMMDITFGGDQDEEVFDRQTRGTIKQTFRYPGRVLPFFAVNTNRNSHLERLEKNLLSGAFVGVKLYPCLGYPVQSPEMEAVLKVCSQAQAPLLQHCWTHGFCMGEPHNRQSDPELWRPYLEDPQYSGFRICFGHFGGDPNFEKDLFPMESGQDDFTHAILRLMRDFPGRVYADISYHLNPMRNERKNPSAATTYWNNIIDLLEKPEFSPYVLYGSDYYMIARLVREDSYQNHVATRLPQDMFSLISRTNPQQYLGLFPDNPGPAILRHIEFLRQNRSKLKIRRAASWIQPFLIQD